MGRDSKSGFRSKNPRWPNYFHLIASCAPTWGLGKSSFIILRTSFSMIGKTDQCCLLVNYLMVFRKEFVWHRYLPVQGHQARLSRNFFVAIFVKTEQLWHPKTMGKLWWWWRQWFGCWQQPWTTMLTMTTMIMSMTMATAKMMTADKEVTQKLEIFHFAMTHWTPPPLMAFFSIHPQLIYI